MMNDIKLDRAKLRRQAQRIESYRVLVSKRGAIYKHSSTAIEKLRKENVAYGCGSYNIARKEDEEKNDDKNINRFSTPSSSMSSSSSSCKEKFYQDFLSGSLDEHCSSIQTEVDEVTSVMTRSLTRKYCSVGALHNRVNFDEELNVVKKWPTNISYPMPDAPTDMSDLRRLINQSFQQVLSFCKNAKVPANVSSSHKNDSLELMDGAINLIDLFPYLTQDGNENNDTHITLHQNDNLLDHQYIICLDEDDENGTLVIQEDGEDCETITLHSGETYFSDNKSFTNIESSFINNSPVPKTTDPKEPMFGIHNDHTYAEKCSEQITVPLTLHQTAHLESPKINKEDEFNLESSLNDLLLNTAILKSLICGETPQEIISFLDNVNL